MRDYECRDRLMLLAGQLSTAAGLGLWIYEGRELRYTSSTHEEEFGKLFALGGGWEFIAAHEDGSHTPVYFSDSQGLVWIGEHVFSSTDDAGRDGLTKESGSPGKGEDRDEQAVGSQCPGGRAASVAEGKPEALILIGPMFISSVSQESIMERLRTLELSLRVRRQMEGALNDVSVVVYSMLEQYAHMLHYMITLQPCPEETFELRSQELDDAEEEQEEADDEDSGIRGERLLLKAVKEGNRDFVRIMDTELNYTGKLLSRTGDSLRDGKNTLIILGALCSRSAMNGGLSHRTARALERLYIRRIEECRTITELATLNVGMLNDYVQRVARCRENPAVSKSVQECCAYINLHLGSDLSAEAIASELGYSEYYFTKKFYNEMGIRLKDYVKQQRIEYAKIELAGTDKSIRDISEGLCFGTRNYFTQVFRDIVGVTPTEYREKQGKI